MATIQDLGKVAYFNKGAYNSEIAYEINDVVSYNGSSYVSLGNGNRGNLPTNATYWSIVASKGDKGDTGKPFVIEKTYQTIETMVADYDNMNVNDYVMISGNIEEEQNATLWTKTETQVSPYKWVYLADFSGASGITGATPNIQIGNVTEGNEPAVTRRAGSTNENPILDFVLKTGAKGDTGATGNGIASVAKTGTSGLTDTYTITYTNTNTSTFDVKNGKGITNIEKTGTSGLVDTYTITYNDGTTSTFEITNGEDGEVTQAQLDETNEQVELANMVYNALPKVTGSGESVTLDDTANTPLKLELKGDMSQETTTGKNLLPNNITSQTINGITITKNNDGSLLINGTSNATTILIFGEKTLQAGTYTISTHKEGTVDNTCYISSVDTSIGSEIAGSSFRIDNSNSKTYTLSETTTISYRFYTGESRTFTNFKIYPMLEQGSTYSDYEPYTNGASPNPDYPQEVEVVTGENKIEVCSKNLLNIPNTEITKSGITVKCENGKINIVGTATSNNTISVPISLNLSSGIYTHSAGKTGRITVNLNLNGDFNINYSNFNTTYELTDYKKYTNYNIQVAQNETYNFTITPQIEKGSTATPYEAYKGQDYTVNLGSIELCKIGTYQDTIYKSNGNWYLHKEVGKVVLDGSEDWFAVTNGIQGGYDYFYSNHVDNTAMKYLTDNMYSDKMNVYNGRIAYTTPVTVDTINISNGDETYLLRIRFLETRIASYTVANFKEWLSNNNVTAYYVLATTTDTQITDTTLISQLNAVKNAVSYDTQTNISQENANKPFIITATAVKDLSKILDNLDARLSLVEE